MSISVQLGQLRFSFLVTNMELSAELAVEASEAVVPVDWRQVPRLLPSPKTLRQALLVMEHVCFRGNARHASITSASVMLFRFPSASNPCWQTSFVTESQRNVLSTNRRLEFGKKQYHN